MQKLQKIGIERYIDIAVLIFLAIFPLLFSPFRTELMGKFIVYILFALSLDLLWGYTGLMSMGHAVLFGIGGYILALSFSVSQGIPSFMARFGITELPVFFQPLTNSGIAFILGLIIPGIVAAFLGYFIINGVSFAVNPGEKLVVLGRNGVGKTTLLKSIMGILPLEQGKISFNNQDVTKIRTFQRSRLGMAYVPQGREIIPNLTVRENLEIGALGHKDINIEQRIARILEYFPALKEHLPRKGGVLSGGQQQQLAIGRALVSSPKMILLDEPTEGIQPNVVAEIAAILNKIHEEMSISIIIVEQNLKFSLRIADKFLIMQKGQIVSTGTIDLLTENIINKYLTI